MAPVLRIAVSSCAVCNVSINKYVDNIKCMACSQSFHLKCAEITIDEFQKLNEANQIKSWKCARCIGDLNRQAASLPTVEAAPTEVGFGSNMLDTLFNQIITRLDDLEGKITPSCDCSKMLPRLIEENRKLREEIKQQNSVIAGVRTSLDKIYRLLPLAGKTANSEVDRATNLQSTCLIGQHNSNKTPTEIPTSRPPTGLTTAKESHQENIVTLSQVSRAIDNATAAGHNTDSPLLSSEESWKTVVRRGRRGRRPVIGSNDSADIKSVDKLGYLHVYRLTPDTSATSLCDYLKQSAPDISFVCRELKKTDRAASFVVSFPLQFVGRVYDASLWPKGAHINRYYFPKKTDRVDDRRRGGNFTPAASTQETG